LRPPGPGGGLFAACQRYVAQLTALIEAERNLAGEVIANRPLAENTTQKGMVVSMALPREPAGTRAEAAQGLGLCRISSRTHPYLSTQAPAAHVRAFEHGLGFRVESPAPTHHFGRVIFGRRFDRSICSVAHGLRCNLWALLRLMSETLHSSFEEFTTRCHSGLCLRSRSHVDASFRRWPR